MAVKRTISSGHKGGEKRSREVEFSTFSEAMDLLKQGKTPAPFESAQHFFKCAVAHRDVEIQSELRQEIDGPKMRANKNPLLA